VFEGRVLRRIFGQKEGGESCLMRSFITCTLHRSDHVSDVEMGRACSMNRREKECIYVISRKARRKETSRKNMT
jgi:hypothetical protein